ncbi:MAG: glycosyltransferase family 4 protein [Anaerolineales bacterium]
MTEMKIALLHYSAPPVIGGVESVIEQQARLFAGAGYDVRVVAGRGQVFDRRVPFVSIPLIDSRHSRVLDVKAELDQGKVPAAFDYLVKDISQKLRSAVEGVDVLIAHNVASLHKNLALTVALKTLSAEKGFARLILWNHDLAWTSDRYKHEVHPGYPWDLLRTAWPGVQLVVTSRQRQEQLAELMAIPLDQATIIPNGIAPAQFLKLGRIALGLVEQLDLWAQSPILLLPVRLTKRKNIELALRILAALRKSMPWATLVITGPLGAHNPDNQAYFEQLKQIRAAENLETSAHFLAELVDGYIPDETIADMYRLADALLIPSREEGFGLPMLEAGMEGLPIFCADIRPLRELGGEQAHYFSPDADPQQVADLIREVLVPSSTYNMRIRVRQKYTWDKVFTEHIVPLLVEKK